MDGLGVIKAVWIGYASNDAIRKNGASGGIITGSLIGLLDQSLLDGAVVNIPDLEKPPKGRSILATTKDEILNSAKSIYCITEIKRGLKKAEQNIEVEKLAVVGLPCQISDFKKDTKRNASLRYKNVVCFGLMCGHNITASATIEALKQSKISINDVQKIRYRSHGWYPFSYRITLKDGNVKDFVWPESPLQKIWDSSEYRPQRCQTCSDFAAESADIACCDAWLDEYRDNMKGYSIVLTHTDKGTDIIQHLIKTKVLTLKKTDESVIQRSQYLQLEQKIRNKQKLERS